MFLRCQKGQKLTTNEQQAIDYINHNLEKISHLTISEIADQAYVSASTISRAIRKCGVDKMSDVRYHVAIGEVAKENICVNEIFQGFYNECKNTIENLDTSTLLDIVQHIREANKIYVLACGFTSAVAERFSVQLQWLGYSASLQTDMAIMNTMHLLAESTDLIIIFTIANTYPILTEAAKKAKSKGARVISLSCVNSEQLAEVSDVMMVGCRRKTDKHNILRLPSVLSLMIMEHAITEYMILDKDKE